MTITEPASLVATFCSVVSNVTCNGGSDGAADVTASGGIFLIAELVHSLVLLQVLYLQCIRCKWFAQLPVQ